MTLDPGQEQPSHLPLPGVAERVAEGRLLPVDAEATGHYGLIIGVTHRGTVDILVRNWPLEPCARKLREAADQLDAAAVHESSAIADDVAFERHQDAMAGGGW